jgi:hypothetical protein
MLATVERCAIGKGHPAAWHTWDAVVATGCAQAREGKAVVFAAGAKAEGRN